MALKPIIISIIVGIVLTLLSGLYTREKDITVYNDCTGTCSSWVAGGDTVAAFGFPLSYYDYGYNALDQTKESYPESEIENINPSISPFGLVVDIFVYATVTYVVVGLIRHFRHKNAKKTAV